MELKVKCNWDCCQHPRISMIIWRQHLHIKILSAGNNNWLTPLGWFNILCGIQVDYVWFVTEVKCSRSMKWHVAFNLLHFISLPRAREQSTCLWLQMESRIKIEVLFVIERIKKLRVHWDLVSLLQIHNDKLEVNKTIISHCSWYFTLIWCRTVQLNVILVPVL